MPFFRIRPLAGLCVLLILLIRILTWCGIPLLPEEKAAEHLSLIAKEKRTVLVAGRVREFHTGNYYDSADLSDVRISDGRRELKVHGVRVYFRGEFPAERGQTAQLRGTLSLPEPATNPGQFDAAAYWRLQRISAFLTGPEILSASGKRDLAAEIRAGARDALLARMRRNYPSEEAELLSAMLLGERSFSDEDSLQRFEAGGAAHMLVISSLHLHLLGMAVYRLCRKLRLSLRASCVLSLGLMLFYVILTGWRASSIRAFAAFFLYVLAKRTGRTYDPATALSAAAILILLSNPYYLFYSSFRLSFGAAAVLLLIKGHGRLAGGLLFQAGMLPLQLYDFFTVSAFALPVNLLLVPLLPAVLVTGAAGLLFGGVFRVPPILLLRFYRTLLEGIRVLPGARIAAGRPGLPAIAAYYILFAGLCAFRTMFSEQKKRLFGFILLIPMAALMFCHPHSGLQMTMLDVGQGDAIGIQCGQSTLLIDGGSSSIREVGTRRIEPFFLSEGAGRIDAVFLTHMDEDHISGVRQILERIGQRRTPLRIGTLVLPDLAEDPGAPPDTAVRNETYHALEEAANKAGARILYAARGDSFTVGDARILVLGPVKGTGRERSANEASLVLSLTYGTFDALFTGDLEGQGEQDLVKTLIENTGTLPDGYDVLKVAHHGSSGSTGEAFLSLVRPKAALISAGAGNPYGHPHEETLTRLRERSAEVFVTAEQGAICAATDGDGAGFHVFLPFGHP